MDEPSQTERRGQRALLVVRNTFEHDARVLRAARTLQRLGKDVTVLAVRGAGDARGVEERDGLHVVRVGPSSILARRAYRAVDRMLASRSAGRPDADAAGPPGAGTPGAGGAERPVADAAPDSLPVARSLLRRLVRWVTTVDFYLRGVAVVRRLRPELVHCNDYNTVWIGVVARILCGSALVYDSHELWPDRNLRPEARWWLVLCEALFFRVAHGTVMTSPAHAEVVARRYRVPAPVVVRNIPEEVPDAPPRANGRRNGDPVAIYVGGVLRHRGIEQSIQALARVDGVRLRLLGPVAPEYREELEGLARGVGVADRVEFARPVPPGEVVEALAAADVGLALFQPVCLSHRLVLPNKLFEYVLAGLPVVGSDLPMIARFVHDHGVGAAVDPEDAGAIADALDHVLAPERHERLREAATGARDAIDWGREREILAGVYRDALARAA